MSETMSLTDWCRQSPESVNPEQAVEGCRRFGWLARWMLHSTVLDKAKKEAPFWPEPTRADLPEGLGACAPLFWGDTEHYPLLRPAFALPLRWWPDERGELPAGLRKLAERVLEQVEPRSNWTLGPAEEGDQPEEWPPLTYDSCWAALAGGLMAVDAGLEPEPTVLASGAGGDFGTSDIDGLEEKLKRAAELGATHLYLPAGQIVEKVKRLAETRGLILGPLLTDTAEEMHDRVRRALAEYSSALTKEPPVPGDDPKKFETCREYYLRHRGDRDAKRRFYVSHLLPTIAGKLGSKIREKHPRAEPTHLVTFVSGSPELTVLLARALNVKHCLLLFHPFKPHGDADEEIEECADWCAKQLSDLGKPQPKLVGRDGRIADDIAREIAGFTEKVPPKCVALDIKPGTKQMTYTLGRIAVKDNWVFNFDTSFCDNQPVPGTERPEVVEVKQ